MKRESSIFGHFWLFQGLIYLTIYIFLGRIFCSTLQIHDAVIFLTRFFQGQAKKNSFSFSFSFSPAMDSAHPWACGDS